MRRTFGLALLPLMAACVSPEQHRQLQSANQQLQAQNASLRDAQRELGRQNDLLRSEIERLGKNVADAAWIAEQKAKLDELLKRYEGGIGNVEGVEVVRTAEGVAFRVIGGVLFAPGRNEISEQGKQTLGKLVSTLRSEGKRIRVDGHTDDTKIQHSRWGTNLRLSAERALAVADFLIQSGIAEDKVGIAGFGEWRPAVEGKDEVARQQNRRVEILMLDQ